MIISTWQKKTFNTKMKGKRILNCTDSSSMDQTGSNSAMHTQLSDPKVVSENYYLR